MDRSDNMNRTRWLIVGIVIVRAIVFLAALIIGSRLALARTIIQAEAAMLTAIVVWLIMLQYLPRLRDEGFAAFDAPRGLRRITLLAFAMFGITLGVGVVAVVGRNMVFGGTLAVAMIVALEFSTGVILSSLGYWLHRMVEPSAARRPFAQMIVGAQILIVLLTFSILFAGRFTSAPAIMRLVALAPVIVVGFFALGVIAHIALWALKSTRGEPTV
jgi:hypothetical protein